MQSLHLENSPICYYADDTANGDRIVFVHAAFADHRMFEKQFEYFAGKYNLLAIDILGHGNSIRARRGDTIEKTSYWLDKIFQKHSIDAAHLVGVSLGAVLAQDFAQKYPDKVLSLACFGGYDVNNFDANTQKGNTREQIKMMLKAMISVKWFAKSNKKISAHTEQAQEEFYKMNAQFRKSSFRFLAGVNKLVNKHADTVQKYPLLVGCGEHDIPAEIEIVNEWAARAGCDKVILKGAGHCANMDAPEEFNRCLEIFWNKHIADI